MRDRARLVLRLVGAVMLIAAARPTGAQADAQPPFPDIDVSVVPNQLTLTYGLAGATAQLVALHVARP